MRVLVCGGRDFHDKTRLYQVLDALHDEQAIAVVISGMARGADTLACAWARDRGIPREEYPAEWDRYGKAAGMRRNTAMLEEGQPDLVVGFPGGVGTAHMLRIAANAGVIVVTTEAFNAQPATVHNLQNERMRHGDVRIDRRTEFGNEFKLGRDGTRDEVIAKFEVAERARIEASPARRAAVRALHGRRLFCWCSRRSCHGDVLARLAAELVQAEP